MRSERDGSVADRESPHGCTLLLHLQRRMVAGHPEITLFSLNQMRTTRYRYREQPFGLLQIRLSDRFQSRGISVIAEPLITNYSGTYDRQGEYCIAKDLAELVSCFSHAELEVIAITGPPRVPGASDQTGVAISILQAFTHCLFHDKTVGDDKPGAHVVDLAL